MARRIQQKRSRQVRYAVVGLGHIAQVAVLPAFRHARRNSVLAGLVSDDPTKRRILSRKYRVPSFSYEQYEDCLEQVDAVYIALPNAMHAEYTIRAARAGVHVLCEKPMAVTADECEQMIESCASNGVKFMVAYRLHFEEINLNAIDIVRRRRIGDPARGFAAKLAVDLDPVAHRVHFRWDNGNDIVLDWQRGAMVSSNFLPSTYYSSACETKVVCRNGARSCAYDGERFVPVLEPLPPGAHARLEQ